MNFLITLLQHNNTIRKGRLEKEKKLASQYQWQRTIYNEDLLLFKIRIHSYDCDAILLFPSQYPFHQPFLKFELSPQLYSFQNLSSYQLHNNYLPIWTPGITANQIVEMTPQYIEKYIILKENANLDAVTSVVNKISFQMIFVILLTLLLRILVGLGSYSGYNDPPKFGDYEAQRHWMELTIHLKPQEWYVESTFNDLSYWPLDYPPLSGYWALLTGIISYQYDPDSVTTRGYEGHKYFMRWTALLGDLLFLYPGLILLIKWKMRKFNQDIQNTYLMLVLSCPILLLIDHGHFQYNSIMLGFSVLGAYYLGQNMIILGSILFTFAFNFKIMSLYYLYPFLAFVAGKAAISTGLRSRHRLSLNLRRIPYFLFYMMTILLTVILTSCIIWYPWIWDKDLFKSVFRAIFPIHRGLYQLPVGTFWCFSNTFLKWRNYFTNPQLFKVSSILTTIICIPAIMNIFLNPKLKVFTIGLFSIAQTCFLFSFHVHEKTNLLPLIFLLVDGRHYGGLMNDYITFGGITLHHLMQEDGLYIQYLSLWISYQLISGYWFRNNEEMIVKVSKQKDILRDILRILKTMHNRILKKFFIGVYLACCVLEQFVKPPEKYPFIFPYIYAMIGYYFYVFMLFYSNILLSQHTIKELRKRKSD